MLIGCFFNHRKFGVADVFAKRQFEVRVLDRQIRDILKGEWRECWNDALWSKELQRNRVISRETTGTTGPSRRLYTLSLRTVPTRRPRLRRLTLIIHLRTFIFSSSNRSRLSACQAVAAKSWHQYNPIFIYGGVGLGKTHIHHQAIGNEIIAKSPYYKSRLYK